MTIYLTSGHLSSAECHRLPRPGVSRTFDCTPQPRPNPRRSSGFGTSIWRCCTVAGSNRPRIGGKFKKGVGALAAHAEYLAPRQHGRRSVGGVPGPLRRPPRSSQAHGVAGVPADRYAGLQRSIPRADRARVQDRLLATRPAEESHQAWSAVLGRSGRPGSVRAAFLSATHKLVRPDASFDDRLRCRISVCCFARCQRPGGESGFVVHPGNATSRSRLRCACRRRPDCTRRCPDYRYGRPAPPPVAGRLSVSVRSGEGSPGHRCRSSHHRAENRPSSWPLHRQKVLALRCRGGHYILAIARATPAQRRFFPTLPTLTVFRPYRKPRERRGRPGKHGPDEEETALLMHHQIATTRVRGEEFSNDFHPAGRLTTKPE